jgi:hypothetical protein
MRNLQQITIIWLMADHIQSAAGWVLESAGVRLHKNNLVCGSKRARKRKSAPRRKSPVSKYTNAE